MNEELKTLAQIRKQIRNGAYVGFDLEEGFGFFKDTTGTNMAETHKGALDKNGIVLIIQPSEGDYIEVVSNKGEFDHMETLKEFRDSGFMFYLLHMEK